MTYSSEVLADSPLVYWRLGDSSGSTAADSSGNSRAGTYVGSPTLGVTGGVSGDTAVDLDGSSQYVQCADAAWQRPPSFTVEALVRADATSFNAIGAKDTDPSGGGGGWAFYIVSGTLRFYANGTAFTGALPVTVGAWTHVAATWDSSSGALRFYVNGTVETPSGIGGVSITQTSATPLLAGVSSGGGGGASRFFHFDGRLDEWAYYGSALSGTRIAAHVAQVSGGGGSSYAAGAVHAAVSSSAVAAGLRAGAGFTSVAVSAFSVGASGGTGLGSSYAAGMVAAATSDFTVDTVHVNPSEPDDAAEYAPELPAPTLPPVVTTGRVLVSVATSLPAPVLVDGRPQ